MLRYINVSYMVDEDVYQRIAAITEVYKKQGIDLSPERMFSHIMILGSKYNMDDKLKFHEWKLGLRDNCK